MSLVPGAGGGDTIPPTVSGVQSVKAGDNSIVVGGTASAPTIETGSLDEIASLHPPVAAVTLNGQDIDNVVHITSKSGGGDLTLQSGVSNGFDLFSPYVTIGSASTPGTIVIQPNKGASNEAAGYNSNLCVDIITSQVITSGSAFVPSNYLDCELSFNVVASVAGSYEVTFGPSTGAEYTITSGTALLAGSDDFFSKRIPAGWKVIVTLTSVTLGNILVQTV